LKDVNDKKWLESIRYQWKIQAIIYFSMAVLFFRLQFNPFGYR